MRYISKFAATAAFAALFAVPAALAATKDYYVHVKTGDVEKAGTNADVFITLEGIGGSSQEIELDSKDYDDFERNDGRWYLVATDADLGRIKSVRLRLADGSEGYASDGWNVNFVYVVAPKLDEKNASVEPWPQEQAWYNGHKTIVGDFYRFRFNAWLDSDDEGKVTVRTQDRVDYEATRHQNVIGPMKGNWSVACSNTAKCTNAVSQTVSFGNAEENANTSEIGASMSASVSASFDVGVGGSAESTISTTLETAVTSAKTTRLSSDNTYSSSCQTEDTFDGMTKVWQWQATANLGFGNVVVKTCQLACTKNEEEERKMMASLPGSYDIPACVRR